MKSIRIEKGSGVTLPANSLATTYGSADFTISMRLFITTSNPPGVLTYVISQRYFIYFIILFLK